MYLTFLPAPYSLAERRASLYRNTTSDTHMSSHVTGIRYTYVSDILEKRGPYREAHLAHAQKRVDAGDLLVVGALADPVDGASFVFYIEPSRKSEIEQFVQDDPYVRDGGLVVSHYIREWRIVAGSFSASASS